jgi:hypothetical protein
LLEVQAHHEREPVVADDEGEANRHGDRHGTGPEQVERHHRVGAAGLGGQERGQGHHRHREPRPHLGRGEAGRASLDGPVGKPSHSQDRGHLPDPVEWHLAVWRRLGPREQGERDRADRHVDGEDEPPAGQRQEAPSTGPEEEATAPPIAQTATARPR